MRSFLKILMAASALMPVAATAQRGPESRAEGRGSWGGQRDGGERGGGDRGDRGGWNRGARPDRGAQAQPQQAQPQQVQQQQVQPGRDQPGRPRREELQDRADRPGRDGRPDRLAGRDDSARPAVAFDRDGRGNDRDDRRVQGRPGRDGFDGRQAYGRGGYDPRQGYGRGGYDARQTYGRGGYDARGAYGSRGVWNRGWRNDNRYAWSNYRSANRGAYRLPRYYAPSGWGYGYRRFGVGFTLSSILFNQNYWIQDPYTYRLPEAYGAYRWVRYYNDALLVDLDSGQVVDTVYDIFW